MFQREEERDKAPEGGGGRGARGLAPHLLQAVPLRLGVPLGFLLTRTDHDVAQRVLHQHAAREGVTRAEVVALRREREGARAQRNVARE